MGNVLFQPKFHSLDSFLDPGISDKLHQYKKIDAHANFQEQKNKRRVKEMKDIISQMDLIDVERFINQNVEGMENLHQHTEEELRRIALQLSLTGNNPKDYIFRPLDETAPALEDLKPELKKFPRGRPVTAVRKREIEERKKAKAAAAPAPVAAPAPAPAAAPAPAPKPKKSEMRPAPKGYELMFSDLNNEWYYYNVKTGKSTFEYPKPKKGTFTILNPKKGGGGLGGGWGTMAN